MIQYEVWLLGDGENNEPVDYDKFLQEFFNKEDAVNYASNINSLKEVCDSNPIGTKDSCLRTIASIKIVVEKCKKADYYTECIEVIYENYLEWDTTKEVNKWDVIQEKRKVKKNGDRN